MKAEYDTSLNVVKTGAQNGGRAVRLIPVSEASAIRMAALMKEFNPRQLGGSADTDLGFSGAPLHPSWVLGLVSAGVEAVLPGSFIRRLEIRYKRQVGREESLSVEIVCVEDSVAAGLHSVAFRVLSAGLDVAKGTALVGEASR